MLEGGLYLGDTEMITSAIRSADELLSLQQETGILKRVYDTSWYHCLTGNAQVALVWSKCYQQTGDDQYRTAARDSVEFIKRHQPLDGPVEIFGGVPGLHPLYGKYMYLRYPN